MINRIYLKKILSFSEVEMELEKGLIVFTGPSGAGKSILMQAILSLFGISDCHANLGEINLRSLNIKNKDYDISVNDEIIIKQIKKDNIRYFLNSQSISRKNLNQFSKNLIKHLHLKDTNDFSSSKLIDFLDSLCLKKDKKFKSLKENFLNSFSKLEKIKKELRTIQADENKLDDLKEFAKFEIEKISSINPIIGEYEELNDIKKKMSKKDKIQEAIEKSNEIFSYTTSVNNVLKLLDLDATFFNEAINELNNTFENFHDSLYELEELDIESVLDRIEKLAELQKRFGSLEEAILYKKKKELELESYENISFEKVILEKNLLKVSSEIDFFTKEISESRKLSIEILEDKINHYLKYLYLSKAKIKLQNNNLDKTGTDEVVFELNGVNLDTISSGEFNRLRLALLTSISDFDIIDNGILFLDEIDANLSGKESSAIAKVLHKLSKTYQIFAISHQPQLTSIAQQHYLVDKKNGISKVTKLNDTTRVNEIARMISGEDITQDAYTFAKNLLDSNKKSK